MRLHWNNLIDSATLTSDNADPNYPLSALKDIHLTAAFRFADLTGGYIDIDLGSAQSVSSVGLIGNLSASATITLKGNSSASWATPPVEETVTAYDRNLLHYFTSVNYRYWRLEIADSGNPDGYIELSRTFIGAYLQMPAIAGGLKSEYEDLSSRVFSPGGQPFSVERPKRRTISVTVPYVLSTEKATVESAFETVGIHTPVWVAVWENDFSKHEPLYSLFNKNTISWQKISTGDFLWQADVAFIESR